MKRVYVAGPYSKGDMAYNVRVAIDVSNLLMDMGYAPYCPHLSHFHQMVHLREYEDWMQQDFAWLSTCDALVRIPGDSSGADREVAFAVANDIPVYESVDEFLHAQSCEEEFCGDVRAGY